MVTSCVWILARVHKYACALLPQIISVNISFQTAITPLICSPLLAHFYQPVLLIIANRMPSPVVRRQKCTFANKETIYYAGDNNTHLNIARMNKEIKINQINRY